MVKYKKKAKKTKQKTNGTYLTCNFLKKSLD